MAPGGQLLITGSGTLASNNAPSSDAGWDRGAVVDAVVRAAQEAALGAIHAGLPAVEADAVARRVVEASPFAGTFGHGLGHGLGLDVHELPRMSTETSDVLEPGNVVTVEPGVYLEGRFGIRIEDDVLVTQSGSEVLTAGIPKTADEIRRACAA